MQERLDCAAAAERTLGAEPQIGGDEPVTRDPVDEARVDVVDDSRAVTVEVVGDDGRRRRRDRGQRRLDLPLERRAPEREPVAADLRELREDEPLGDGEAGEVAYGEERAGRIAERLLRLPDGELVDREETAGARLAEDVELFLAGVRVIVAKKRECERIGMPDRLEHGRPS